MIWTLLLAGLTVSLSSGQVTVRDPMVVELVVTAERPYTVDLDSVRSAIDEMEPQFRQSKEDIVDPVDLGDGQFKQTIRYRLEPWEVGQTGVALLPLRLTAPGREPILLYSDWHAVSVVLPDELIGAGVDLAPVALGDERRSQMSELNRERLEHERVDALEQQSRRWERSQWLLRLFGLLLLVALLAWAARPLFRRLRRRASSFLVRGDPRKEAFAKLKELESQQLPRRGLYELYYVRLTEIVRFYLEEMFDVRAPERTTQEFLEEIVAYPQFDEEVRERLRLFLSEADLVKFARFEPTGEQCLAAAMAARRLIEWEVECTAELATS